MRPCRWQPHYREKWWAGKAESTERNSVIFHGLRLSGIGWKGRLERPSLAPARGRHRVPPARHAPAGTVVGGHGKRVVRRRNRPAVLVRVDTREFGTEEQDLRRI